MKTTRGISPLVGLIVLACVGLSQARGQEKDVSAQSPFLPRGGSGIATTTENSPVELRGISNEDGGTLFGLFDPVKKLGWWVKANDPGKDFPVAVKNYDAANSAVTVEYQGRVLNLALQSAKIAAAPAMAMVGPPRPGPVPGQPAVAQAPSADDTRRLEAVAAEVARRRQARQAAAQQQPQPPPQVTPNVPNRQR